MFRRDYLMDQIEKLTVMLHKILFHKEHKQFDEAQKLLGEASRHLLGLNLKSLKALSTPDIIALLSYQGIVDKGKAVVLADLLREQGAVYDAAEDEWEACECMLKSLDLLLEVHRLEQEEDSGLGEELTTRLEEAVRLLAHRVLPVEVMRRLFAYYAASGAYAKAEDMLYYLFEDDPDRLATSRMGFAFYESLLSKPDGELTEGGFSVSEAEEGMYQWKRLAGAMEA